MYMGQVGILYEVVCGKSSISDKLSDVFIEYRYFKKGKEYIE